MELIFLVKNAKKSNLQKGFDPKNMNFIGLIGYSNVWNLLYRDSMIWNTLGKSSKVLWED